MFQYFFSQKNCTIVSKQGYTSNLIAIRLLVPFIVEILVMFGQVQCPELDYKRLKRDVESAFSKGSMKQKFLS